MSATQFKTYGSLYHVLLSEADILVIFHRYFGTHIGHDDYIYTKMCKSAEKPKIKVGGELIKPEIKKKPIFFAETI